MGRSCVRSWHANACVRGFLHSQSWHVFDRTPRKVVLSYCSLLGGGSPACPAVAPAALAMGTPWPATGDGTRTLTRPHVLSQPFTHTPHTQACSGQNHTSTQTWRHSRDRRTCRKTQETRHRQTTKRVHAHCLPDARRDVQSDRPIYLQPRADAFRLTQTPADTPKNTVTHTDPDKQTHTHSHTHTRTHRHTHIPHAPTRNNIQTRIRQRQPQADIDTRTQTTPDRHTQIHTHRDIQTGRQTDRHTYRFKRRDTRTRMDASTNRSHPTCNS